MAAKTVTVPSSSLIFHTVSITEIVMHGFLWLIFHMEMCPTVIMLLHSVIDNGNVKNSTTAYAVNWYLSICQQKLETWLHVLRGVGL